MSHRYSILVALFIALIPFSSANGFQESSSSALQTSRLADEVLNVWPGQPPGKKRNVGEEENLAKKTDKPIAGRPIIRLGNVTTPQLHIFHPPQDKRNGAAVVICPGGGFHILAWDLEGTEVATWLNSIGVTAIVLKYRVPTRSAQQMWLAPTQDAQRAISIVRSNAAKWKIDTKRIGVLGFSAGGRTAAMASYGGKRFYTAIDEIDRISFQPDFSILVYAAQMANERDDQLRDDLKVNANSPPTFMAHAFDDFVHIKNTLALMGALKDADVPSELHIYDRGGHGYGLRTVANQPVTNWAATCAQWMSARGILNQK